MPAAPAEPAMFKQFFTPATIVQLGAFVLPDLTGDGLRVEWDILLSRTSSADQGTISIYNLAAVTRLAVHTAWRAAPRAFLASFSLGWDGVALQLFRGQVWRFVPEAREGGSDVVTTVDLGDGAITMRDGPPVLSAAFASGPLTLILQALVGALGVPIDPVSLKTIQEKAALLPIATWETYVIAGDPSDRLDELIDTLGLEWKIYGGVLIVMDKGIAGVTNRITAPVISPSTGLLSWSPTDDGGLELVALANPRVIPGVQIAVSDEYRKPIGAPRHRVSSVQFTGTNYGDSLMTIVARRAV